MQPVLGSPGSGTGTKIRPSSRPADERISNSVAESFSTTLRPASAVADCTLIGAVASADGGRERRGADGGLPHKIAWSAAVG